MFIQNKPAQLSYILAEITDELNEDGSVKFNQYDVSDITHFYCLHIDECPILQCDYTSGIQLGSVFPFPDIVNLSNKTIHNMNCYISVWWDNQSENLYNNDFYSYDNDLEFIKTNENSAYIKCQPDYLSPHNILPKPFFYTMYKTYDQPHLTIFSYDITYEGVSSPKELYYYLRTYLEDPHEIKTYNQHIRDFIDNEIYSDWIGNPKTPNPKKALIINDKFVGILKNFKNHDEYLKFKWNTIDDLIVEKKKTIE